MRVAFNHYRTQRTSNGALYFYSETSKLLTQAAPAGVHPEPHDVFELLRQDERDLARFVRRLGPDDVVVCNAGPYGHFYHYLRERYDGRFRIIRDIRTSSWGGYHFQEMLAGPLNRPGDLVLFPSEFCRAYFIHHHAASLHAGNTAVSYPLATSFPATRPARPRPARGLRIGYLGRVSADKNFAQVLDFLAAVRRDDRAASLQVAGHVEGRSAARAMQVVRRELEARGIPADAVAYHGHLPYQKIWAFFEQIDVFFFPAVSSVESLGRVLLEAQHAGVSTIAGGYAAAPEILPEANLLDIDFRCDTAFDMGQPFSFGSVRLETVAETIRACTPGVPRSRSACYSEQVYLDYVTGEPAPAPAAPVAPRVQAFIRALEIRHDLSVTSGADSLALLGPLLQAFNAYHDNRLSSRLLRLVRATGRSDAYPNQRSLHVHRLLAPGQRLLPSHAREHCAAAGYRPVAVLNGEHLASADRHARQSA
ncbi:glycosyltransferase family 4 protein [Burkholderia sp. FERM BP-3421]|jgi:glycosyltransferase involved in cell wall biosynthesis|uniref:glycosyltransferase family 4 protein n=1 Tax=Burkholderia sp. FERM BP-3421 TaxID=1494466 RepID=UPI0023601A84|nr:glycosyltransferase family 4 protein [Burkholderia sp. FERM BP-3421]WDD92408.1 glycosyltransferase family 4 protein [Burkholderia sp. FERM BP-3421]